MAEDNPIYFYPHAYLRDRQLDTIRTWPKHNALNQDICLERIGNQVSKNLSVAPSRRSLKSILPLINVKKRPSGIPVQAIVYLWSGIILSGKFITDIDNPYAFTAYNVFATRLYKSFIRFLLSRKSCLEIRCMSEACRSGLIAEFGPTLAQKTKVSYPKMPVKINTKPPSSEGHCHFLFVSTQFEIKGGAALLKAFRHVVEQFSGAKLTLVTHLPENYAQEVLECPGVAVHQSALTRDEIGEQFLSKADVLVHPTYFDSFGMIVLEAMAYGLPIIATHHYAIPEMVHDGINGILIEPPVSIWNGIKPSSLFSSIAKVQKAIQQTDSTNFENILTTAMLHYARNTDQRHLAGEASLSKVVETFQ